MPHNGCCNEILLGLSRVRFVLKLKSLSYCNIEWKYSFINQNNKQKIIDKFDYTVKILKRLNVNVEK